MCPKNKHTYPFLSITTKIDLKGILNGTIRIYMIMDIYPIRNYNPMYPL